MNNEQAGEEKPQPGRSWVGVFTKAQRALFWGTMCPVCAEATTGIRLVLAGELVLDLAEDGTALLLLVLDTGGDALASWCALG